MSKNDAKAFNTFAQKLKKNNKDYQAEIDRFKQVQHHLPVSARHLMFHSTIHCCVVFY